MLEQIEGNDAFSCDRLLFRNQFMLGPGYLEGFPGWQRFSVTKNLYLTAHPALNVVQIKQADLTVTALGSILDPDNPDAENEDILKGLIVEWSGFEHLLRSTCGFGGRWVIIIQDGKRAWLFNDATGLRQVHYTDMNCVNDLWCASQPRMLADALDLEMSSEGVDYIDSYPFRANREFRWPGSASPYKEICHLLPNHYLDLQSGKCHRFWPDRELETLSFDDGVDRVSNTLRSLVRSASKRFNLAVSVTAGLDSRTILAASKEWKDTISYMTVRQFDKPDDHEDVAIPGTLLPTLGLRHDVVNSSLLIDHRFMEIFQRNVPVPHSIYAPDAQAILKRYHQEKVVLTGGVSEVGRWSFRNQLPRENWKRVTAQDLVKVQKMSGSQYALSCFSKWLKEADQFLNVDTLDMFEWEQGHGCWLANCYLEFDTAWKDIIAPFNCRKILTTMLSVDEQHRRPPGNDFHLRMIERLWPEVLSVPINPGAKNNRSFYKKVVSHVPRSFKNVIKRGLHLSQRGQNAN